MSARDPYDFIRQNTDIKELARLINSMKARLDSIEQKLGLASNTDLINALQDTRTDIETSFGSNTDDVPSIVVDYVDLTENAAPGTPVQDTTGRLYAEDVTGFTTLDWLWYDGTTSYDLDLLRDTIAVVRNNTGGTLVKGTVVNAIGSTGNFATVAKLDATSNDEDDDVLGLVFEDIDNNSFGIVLTSGDLENYDTSMFNAGDFLFVDPSTPGGLTSTRPSSRDREYPVGEVIKSNVAGSILVKPKRYIDNDFRSLHYSTFLEQHKITISSNGTVITATLDNFQGDSYLQAFFSNGKTIITPTLTVDTNGTLTAGTDTVPQINYIYILASAPTTLVASTSGWPTAEHIRCATVNLLSAATTQTDAGAFTNQVWNDEPSFEGANPRGHIAHVGEVIRNRGALWFSGVAGAGSTSGYITITDPGGGNEVYFETGSGVVYQFHEQTWAVFDSATDDMFVKNDNTTPYNRINDLRADITEDSTGTTITNNRYFNLIFWGVVNETSTNNWVGVNLPSGFYTSANAARVDRDKYDDYSIPDQFKGVAFLICRITFQLTSTNWTVVSTDDLRGLRPSIAQGAFGSAQKNEFLDSNFRIQDDSDPTKQIAFQASGITTATTRTITMADKSFTISGDFNYFLPPSALFFEDAAGTSTQTRVNAFQAAEITVDGSGVYQYISFSAQIPADATDTVDINVYYGYNDTNDTAFNFKMWFSAYSPTSSTTTALAYNVLIGSQGSSIGIGTTNLNIRKYTRTVTNSNIASNTMLAVLLEINNFTASGKISIYGIDVIFNE